MKKRLRLGIPVAGVICIVGLLYWTTPTSSSGGTIKIWDRNNHLLYESAGEVGNKIPVGYEKFPEYLTKAVVAAEDNSFWTNPGVDVPAMLRSLYLDIRAGKIVSGASTISQQLSRKNGNRIIRKIQEVLTAFRLNMRYDKKTIMSMYLNQMYFGNMAFGAQAAAMRYFDKDVSQLSLAQCALLAGIVSSPTLYNPYENPEGVIARQQQVLDLMVKNKLISDEEAKAAREEKISFNNESGRIAAAHFVNYVLAETEDLKPETAHGLNVYTTLDLADQNLAEDITRTWVTKLATEHNLSNAALVMLENDSGAVRVMVGGVDYFDATNSGQVNLTISPRQPGSALKPITYAAAFDMGYTPASLIEDIPKVYVTKKGDGFTPNNYDGKYHGMVLAREALASSLNLPAVEMLDRIGIDKFLVTATKLGITTLKPDPKYDLALTLGGGEVTLLDLANVYASFGRKGNYLPTFAISKMTDDTGRVIYTHQTPGPKPVWGNKSTQIAYLIDNILSDPRARILGFGEKNPLVLSFPAAVKTGTTTDWHDNWTVGYTPRYTVGVWVGNNNNDPMINLTGITGAAPIWNQFFEEWAKGKQIKNFERPDGMTDVEICKIDGLLPDSNCQDRQTEIFIEETQPKSYSQTFKSVAIDIRNGLLASEKCPSKFVTTKILPDYPPGVFEWAVNNGLEVIPRSDSNLCPGGDKQTGQSETFVRLTYPLPNALFQYAPASIKNQKMDLEINSSEDIISVQWWVDGKLLEVTTSFPFSVAWPISPGHHTIRAVGISRSGTSVPDEVRIQVDE